MKSDLKTLSLIVLTIFLISCGDESGNDVAPNVVTEFSANKTSITQGESISFTDESTGSPNAWSWVFGSEGTATVANPSFSFHQLGTHQVSLTASNTSSTDTEVKASYIEVDTMLTTDLVEYYTFNGDMNSTRNGINGEVSSVSMAEGRHGLANTAIGFTKAGNSHLGFAGQLINIQQDFALSFWFNCSDTSGIQYLVTSRQSEFRKEKGGLDVAHSAGNISITARQFSGSSLSTKAHLKLDNIIKENTWYHVAVVRSGTTLTLFIDGVEKVNTTFSGSPSNGSYWHVGSIKNTTDNSSHRHFEGRIDDIRFYTKGLTATEVTSLFTNE